MSLKTPTLSPTIEAALWTIFAGATFAGSQAIIRYSAQQLPPFEVLFLRNAFSALFMLPWILGGGFAFMRKAPFRRFLSRSLTMLGGMMLWFYALSIMPLPEASALSFATPLFVTIGAALFLKEDVRARRWVAVALGFLGVMIMMRPGAGMFSVGALVVLGSCLFNAASGLQMRMLAKTEGTAAVVAYTSVLMTPLSLVPAVFVWETPSWEMLGWSALLAGVLTIGHLAHTRAARMAEASALMPYQYLRLPFVMLLAYVCFGEVLDAWGWAGAAVIAGSSIYIARREATLAREARKAKEAAKEAEAVT